MNLKDILREPECCGTAQNRKIHARQGVTRKNFTKHAMNRALIAVGVRNALLRKEALRGSKAVGKVDVDYGQTSYKAPDAAEYIRKTLVDRELRKASE